MTAEVLNPIEKSVREPKSLKYALRAMCYECVGRELDPNPRKAIGCCTSYACPLWSLRPYRHMGESAEANDLRTAALQTPGLEPAVVNAARKPASRRAAVNAKCMECMGSARDMIRECAGEFPQMGQNGYRGCPLYPHRPFQP